MTKAGEIFGFIVMNFLDFLQSLGYLYLFYKMGLNQIRRERNLGTMLEINTKDQESDLKTLVMNGIGKDNRESGLNNQDDE